MLAYLIFIATFISITVLFFCILDWRWQRKIKDLKKIFKRLDLPQIDMEDIHTKVPYK